MSAAGWILVTGANRGLGLEVCRDMLRNGSKIIACARTQTKANEAAKELIGSTGQPDRNVIAVALDVTQPDTFSDVVKQLREYPGEKSVSVLVNNAAIFVDGWTKNNFEQHMLTNLIGPVQFTTEALPLIADGGHIINVSSEYGAQHHLTKDYAAVINKATFDTFENIPFVEEADMSPYGCYKVSKAALNRATRLFSKDMRLTSRNIACNCVDPGWVRTDMGGPNATRSIPEGAASILDLVKRDKPPTGGFFKDGEPISYE